MGALLLESVIGFLVQVDITLEVELSQAIEISLPIRVKVLLPGDKFNDGCFDVIIQSGVELIHRIGIISVQEVRGNLLHVRANGSSLSVSFISLAS